MPMKTAKNRFEPLGLPVPASEPNLSGFGDVRGGTLKRASASRWLPAFLKRFLAQVSHA